MIQSPDGNLAIGFLPKSMTISISSLISSCFANSLLILAGTNSRNSSSSSRPPLLMLLLLSSLCSLGGLAGADVDAGLLQRSTSGRRMDGCDWTGIVVDEEEEKALRDLGNAEEEMRRVEEG